MKKSVLAVCMMVFGATAFSQTCDVNDSTLMGSGNNTDVFYSLKKGKATGNGTVSTASSTNWHLAFSVQPSRFPTNPANGVAIRINAPNGENAQASLTGLRLARMTGKNWSNWYNLDTTGLFNLPELLDSDSTWDLSAFTSGYSVASPFDFKWGTYNSTSHKVEGTTVYVLYNKSAGWYKKVFINDIVGDTMWNFTIANIDNTDSNFVSIRKNAFMHRNFAYYDVLNNTVLDREPDNRTWDLLWTKYRTFVTQGPVTIPYSVMGVLHNNGVKVGQNNGKKCSEVWLANKTAKSSPTISTMGWDWKTFNGTGYTITDTFVYFIEAKDTHTYKFTFVSFNGGPLGKTRFSFYESTVGINDLKVNGNVTVYPNPASSSIRVDVKETVLNMSIYNMKGQLLHSSNGATEANVSDLTSGMYYILVQTEKGLFSQSFIKE